MTDRLIFIVFVVVLAGLGLATAIVPGLEDIIGYTMLAILGLVVVGWILRQVIGEIALEIECRKPAAHLPHGTVAPQERPEPVRVAEQDGDDE